MEIEIKLGNEKEEKGAKSIDDLRKLSSMDPEQNEYDNEGLDCMIDILHKAEKIKEDKMLYQSLQKRMKEKVKEIESVDDLRAAAVQKSLDEDK